MGETFQGVKSGMAFPPLTFIVTAVLFSFLFEIRDMTNFSKKEKQIMSLGFILIILTGINDAIALFFNFPWIRLYDVAFLPIGFIYTYVQFSRYSQLHSNLDNRVKEKTEELQSINDKLSVQISYKNRSESVNKTLFAISNTVNITSDLDALYTQIHYVLGDIIDVTNFFIAIVDIKKHTLYFPYHVDTMDDDFSPITNFDTNDSLTGLVVSQRKPILLKKNELEKLSTQKSIWGPVPLIWMGAPLIVKDEIIGVVAVQSYLDSNLYKEQDLQVLSGVSDQIAIAIDRKQAEDALVKSEKKLLELSNQTEQLSLAAASMISMKEEQEIFTKISQSIVEFSDFKRVIISLFKEKAPFRDIIGFGGVEEMVIDRLRKVEMPKSWYDKVFVEKNIIGHKSYYIPHTKKNILNQEATIYGSGPVSDCVDKWHPEDNLFVKMNNEKGNIIGVISVDDSKSGLKPT
ncbi:MAG: GAF domain-containing protein, partial [Desulfobacula sp.]|nr:GAF domain-containing protein [Desulfobacula sp.]